MVSMGPCKYTDIWGSFLTAVGQAITVGAVGDDYWKLEKTMNADDRGCIFIFHSF